MSDEMKLTGFGFLWGLALICVVAYMMSSHAKGDFGSGPKNHAGCDCDKAGWVEIEEFVCDGGVVKINDKDLACGEIACCSKAGTLFGIFYQKEWNYVNYNSCMVSYEEVYGTPYQIKINGNCRVYIKKTICDHKYKKGDTLIKVVDTVAAKDTTKKQITKNNLKGEAEMFSMLQVIMIVLISLVVAKSVHLLTTKVIFKLIKTKIKKMAKEWDECDK